MERRPLWLRKPLAFDDARPTQLLLSGEGVHTVCREARCPNLSECFRDSQATFLILGTVCTRRCAFCHVTKGVPAAPDGSEPGRVASAARRMKLRHVVLTSVTRDDLSDKGASAFARTVEAVRASCPEATLELLIPDLGGDERALSTILDARPDILGHNVETVPRLYAHRPGASYERSRGVLSSAKRISSAIQTKSALLLGLGETKEEVLGVMKDLRTDGCDFLALGQYLRPSLAQTPVVRYVTPEEFAAFREEGARLGFAHVESGPYVRSSYRAASYRRP